MKRQAVIIVNPGESGKKGYLKGALKDADIWQEYLKSLSGGEWYSHEIETFINEDKSTVKNFLKQCEADYGFVAFSGHGFYGDISKLTFCKLDDGFLSEEELCFPKIDKQTISIDACREETSEEAMLKLLIKARMFAELGEERRTSTRKYFDSQIRSNSPGVIWLFGASKNEEAGEDEDGGDYTRSIIECGKEFSLDKKTRNDIFDVEDAILASEVYIKKFKPVRKITQTPCIKRGRRALNFPFAVNLYDKTLEFS